MEQQGELLNGDQSLIALGGQTRRFPSTHPPQVTMRRPATSFANSSSRPNGERVREFFGLEEPGESEGREDQGLSGETIEFNVSGDDAQRPLDDSLLFQQHQPEYREEEEEDSQLQESTEFSSLPAGPTKYYAVFSGRQVGIFDVWEEARRSVTGFPHATYKGFKTFEAAGKWLLDAHKGSAAIAVKSQRAAAQLADFNSSFRQARQQASSRRSAQKEKITSSICTPIRSSSGVANGKTRLGLSGLYESPISSNFDVSDEGHNDKGERVRNSWYMNQELPSQFESQSREYAQSGNMRRLPSQYDQRDKIMTSHGPMTKADRAMEFARLDAAQSQGRSPREREATSKHWLAKLKNSEPGEAELPAYLPYVDEQYWGELKKCGLEYVVFPLGREDLEECIHRQAKHISEVASTKMQAMAGTRQGSMGHLVAIANLIQDTMIHAPEQEEDQAVRLRGLSDQLLRIAYDGEDPCQGVVDEVPTLHYLHAYMVTTMQLVREKRRLLEGAQHLDRILTSAFRKGFPAHVVQQARMEESPMTKQARTVEEARSDRVIRRAYTCLLSSGVERQKIVDGTQSTTTGYSHQTELSDSDSEVDSEAEATVITQATDHTRRSTKSSKGKKRGKGKEFMESVSVRSVSGQEIDLGRAVDTMTAVAVLEACKKKSYVKMCQTLMEHGLEDYVTAQVHTRIGRWLDTQRQGWTEEIRITVEGFTIDSWVCDGKYVPGGSRELDTFGYEGRSHTISWAEMWVAFINIAQQHNWPVNTMAQQLLAGATLEGQAKETMRTARKSDNILSSSAPLAGDIIEGLYRLTQIRVRMYLLVGKPIDGGVLNTWIQLIRWDEPTAKANFDKFTQLKELFLHKQGCTPQGFKEELIRQAMLTTAGQIWWDKMEVALNQEEKINTTMGRSWVLDWDIIQSSAVAIHHQELVKEQIGNTLPATGGKGKNSFVSALLVDEQVQAQGGASREGEQYRTTSRERGRSQSPQERSRHYRDRSSSPYRGGGRNDYYGPSDRGDRGYGDHGHYEPRDQGRDDTWEGQGYRGGGNRGEWRGQDRGEWRGQGDRGRGGGNSYSRRFEMKQCACGIEHFEAVDGNCPWRPVDKDGKPTITEYNGWDIKYYCSKTPQAQGAMRHKIAEIPRSHAAAMPPDMYKKFQDQVAKMAKASP